MFEEVGELHVEGAGRSAGLDLIELDIALGWSNLW
jgi:hypothetical protein